MYTESETDGVIKDPCKGDSGGPLIVNNGGQPLLVGVLEVSLSFFQQEYMPYSANFRATVTTAVQTRLMVTEAGATLSLRGIGFWDTFLEVLQVILWMKANEEVLCFMTPFSIQVRLAWWASPVTPLKQD